MAAKSLAEILADRQLAGLPAADEPGLAPGLLGGDAARAGEAGVEWVQGLDALAQGSSNMIGTGDRKASMGTSA